MEGSLITKIMDQKQMSMFERYNTVDRDDAHQATKRLDDYLTKPSGGDKLPQYYRSREEQVT